MKKINKFLCRIGLHRFRYFMKHKGSSCAKLRECLWCGLQEIYYYKPHGDDCYHPIANDKESIEIMEHWEEKTLQQRIDEAWKK